jgi:hypothetical protein
VPAHIGSGLPLLEDLTLSSLRDPPTESALLSSDLSWGYVKATGKYLDSNLPSDASDIQENSSKATDTLAATTETARQRHVGMGGQASSLGYVPALTNHMTN